jgi:hypothetical protein
VRSVSIATQIWQSMSLVELEEATGLAEAGY